jgi:hypothetical protein
MIPIDNLEPILARIRLEAARRNGGVFHPKPTLGLAETKGAPSIGSAGSRPELIKTDFRPRADGKYDLHELLRYNDREFIQVAYMAALRRPADRAGFAHYLDRLRSGRPKEEILIRLCRSTEGRRAGSKIHGLWFIGGYAEVSQWPVIGWVMRFLVGLWALPNVSSCQRASEGRLRAHLELELREIHAELRALKASVQSCGPKPANGFTVPTEPLGPSPDSHR